MNIRVIGCGNAFSNKNFNQCFMLSNERNDAGQRRMLIDCGYQTGAALYKAGVDLKSITDVYVSHQHADHIGFLEGLAFQRYDWAKRPQSTKESGIFIDTKTDKAARLPHNQCAENSYAPNLIANSKLMDDLWEHSLKGGLQSIEGVDCTLDTFFYTVPIESNDTFDWAGWNCKIIQQIHIMTGSMISNTFGLFMTRASDGYKVYFTTDSQHCSPRQMEVFYAQADLIIQDCECIGVDTVKRESKFMSGVHANYAQLAGWESANSVKLPKKIKAKMYLSHYQDFVSEGKDGFGQDCDWAAMALADGFKGFVKVGQEITI